MRNVSLKFVLATLVVGALLPAFVHLAGPLGAFGSARGAQA